ncbi:MAG TPA: CotH kinase family protein, partial [Cryomorphaceae bacterium]|nr:CotH kinase family protein [Cryomorphaceae bacterium]
KDDDWILNADYIDKTMMRHNISYDIFREMDDRNVAAKSAYFHLSVDSVYEGLYLIMEEVNGAMVGLNKKDTMAMLFKDPSIFFRETLPYVQDSTNYYQQKFPKLKRRDKTNYIERFRNFMFDSSDRDFANEIGNWVDIQNVIDWHIMLLFSNNDDGVSKNFYLYKLDAETPFRFAIWDYDHAYGRDGDNERNMMERPVNIDRAILLTRLLAIPQTEYIPKLRKRWFELRERDVISVENFEKHIQKNDAIIRDEVPRNVERWPVDEEWYYDENTYEEELELMREYMQMRIPQLDQYFHDLSY